MTRRLWLMVSGSGVVVAAGFAAAFALRTQQAQYVIPADPVSVPCYELPLELFEHGKYRGQVVQVGFELPLTPTADPLVWEYRPGIPAEHFAPLYRVQFNSTPLAPRKLPVVVTGTVAGIEFDGRRRLNRVPGVVVITSASVAPSSP